SSAVVVDLPLVPVMATKGERGACARRSRQNSSMSPMTSMPHSRARRTLQCGSGWVSGTPGASTSASKREKSASTRSAVAMPALTASSIAAVRSSVATTSAPPAMSALALASPDAPRPTTATRLPRIVSTAITRSPQLQGREPDQGKDNADDPEADHDLRLGPAEMLEVMVDRRHLEDALAGEFERGDLNDHRDGLEYEQAADDGEHDLMLGGHRDRAEHAAHGERAGIAHEN